MAHIYYYYFHYPYAFLLIFSYFLIHPTLSALVQEQPLILKYHNGALLKGNISLNLIWYGQFTPTQRSIIVDFINSLSPSKPTTQQEPSTSSWWKTTEYYSPSSIRSLPFSYLKITHQILHPQYTLGKNLKSNHLLALASKVNPGVNTINVVLTSKDVYVDGFCMNRCGTHGGYKSGAYIWVGNSEVQCPGYCAWPFHQPIYGPQTPPLVAPNGDVGVDGMIITLASLFANTVTNPFNGGYFQGPATAPLEAASACTGLFGPGSYPGYPGQLLTDKVSGGSFNAYGVNGRKYLLPSMWDPKTSECKMLV